jgi:hypothetical protein
VQLATSGGRLFSDLAPRVAVMHIRQVCSPPYQEGADYSLGQGDGLNKHTSKKLNASNHLTHICVMNLAPIVCRYIIKNNEKPYSSSSVHFA